MSLPTMIEKSEFNTQPIVGLPPGGERFLNELCSSLESKYIESIMLFGSTVTGGVSESSDIDLIIVLAEDTPDWYRKKIKKDLYRLASVHLETETSSENRLEKLVQRLTGAYRSGFVATETEIRDGKFHRIFNTSRVAYVIAPWRTVLSGAFNEAVSVFQEPVYPEWSQINEPLDHSITELFRSMIMTLILAVFQLPYSLFTDRNAIYSHEAYKWTVYNIAYHVLERPHNDLNEALDVVPDLFGYHHKFREVRKSPTLGFCSQPGLLFILILLYLWAFKTVLIRKWNDA